MKAAVKMVNIIQITKSDRAVPILAAAILMVLFGLGVFAVGFDQGQLFSLIEGPQAFHDMYLHEFSHDTRHASGFPCH